MDDLTPAWSRGWRDIAQALAFFTRVPVPGSAQLDLNRIAWAAPVAGAAIALIGTLALAICGFLGLPVLFAAGLATAAMTASTGALHEDGLADIADGFGGGGTRERKLEIMRDSRIGTYGAAALALALILRVGALAAVFGSGVGTAAGALVAVAALSRAGALAPLVLLDPARADGAGAAAGRLEATAFAAAAASAFLLALIAGLAILGLGSVFRAAIGAGVGAAGMVALARRQIGGQTGDVAGAAQQWAEIGAWTGLLIGHSTP